MLSYQHGFHAGNFADVHKHVALTLALEQLTRKDAPLAYLDTHAGRGLYDLTSVQAQKTAEHTDGIVPVWNANPAPPALSAYLSVVGRYNPDGRLRHYPGSPAIARALLRANDRLLLCELHPAEAAALRALFRGDRRVVIHARDALEGLRALTPPKEKRGLVLVDPSYELKTDYRNVAEELRQARRYWSAGVFIIWYPLLAEPRHQPLIDAVLGDGQRKVLRSELHLPVDRNRQGMRGSGLLIANPPWQFETAFNAVGETLASLLVGPGCTHKLGWLVPE